MRAALLALGVALLVAGCAETTTPTPTGTTASTTTTTPSPPTSPTPSPTASTTMPSVTPTPAPTPADGGLPCDGVEPGAPDASWRAEKPRVALRTTMGDIVVELEMEAAPITAGNFLNLTRSGFYDGVTFHRVVKGFVIQGGDPNSKDADPTNDGMGGPGHDIPDEFNPTLRHDRVGVLSMATAGPDTGGSQFFITVNVTEDLDDRHAVFGRVAEGYDVAENISRVPVGAGSRPVTPVVITDAEELEAAPFDALHAIGAHPVIASKRVAPGEDVRFAVVLSNHGTVRDAIALATEAPVGWTCIVDRVPVVPAGTARIAFVTLVPPADATGEHAIRLLARGTTSDEPVEATVRVVLGGVGDMVARGDTVRARYAGMLTDGRLFDTNIEAVAKDAEQPKLVTPGGYHDFGVYEPFDFEVGGALIIPGFSNLADGAREGETATTIIPWRDAYAQGDMYQFPLVQRDLVFELEIVEIVS